MIATHAPYGEDLVIEASKTRLVEVSGQRFESALRQIPPSKSDMRQHHIRARHQYAVNHHKVAVLIYQANPGKASFVQLVKSFNFCVHLS